MGVARVKAKDAFLYFVKCACDVSFVVTNTGNCVVNSFLLLLNSLYRVPIRYQQLETQSKVKGGELLLLLLLLLLYIYYLSGFGGLVVSMLASGTQDRGIDPGRSCRIFRAKESTATEVKPSPMSQICAACQRTLGLRGSRNHRQN